MKFSKKVSVSLIGFALSGVLFFSIPIQSKASSYFPVRSYHTYTPRSWRGTYKSSNGSTMKVNTYSVSYNGKTYYKNNWSGWHKLAFAKVDSTHYTFNALAKAGYQSSRRWRLKYKNGKKELINSQMMGVVIVWHQYSKPQAAKIQTADNQDFFWNAWSPAYLDIDSDGAALFNSKTDAENDGDITDADFKLTDPQQKVYAKWPSKYSTDILQVKVNGQEYYLDNEYHDLRPYNAIKRQGAVDSYFKPTDKDALLAYNQHVYKGSTWSYYGPNNSFTLYEFNGKSWEKI